MIWVQLFNGTVEIYAIHIYIYLYMYIAVVCIDIVSYSVIYTEKLNGLMDGWIEYIYWFGSESGSESVHQ